VQLDGILGSHGIAPAARYLARVREARGGAAAWLEVPTLLWLGASDGALHALCAGGALLALALVAGLAPRLALAGLFASYLSLVSAGGIFLAYQWDNLLLETGFLSLLVAPGGLLPFRRPWTPRPPLAIWLPRCLLAKLLLLSGAAKLLSGDPTWRELTALSYHFETQPLPTWSSWAAHVLPAAAQRAATIAALGLELLLPACIFAGRRGRLVAFAAAAGLQLLITATGNYGFFNALSLVLCISLLDDRALAGLVPARWRPAGWGPLRSAEPASARASPAGSPAPKRAEAPGRAPLALRARRAGFGLAASALLALSALPLLARLGLGGALPDAAAALERRLAPFRVANPYGLFAVMTTARREVEILGSEDGRTWRPYVFRYKPGPPERAPRFAPLHLPRLDWQLWFAALGRCEESPWLGGLFLRLLEGEPAVLGLLAASPFAERPPRFVRADLWRYRFAAPGEPAWWRREPLGRFCPPLERRGGRLAPVWHLEP
jgi:uncharacterized membrane protein YphA (DoxX/SURF4 family)